MAKNPFSFKIDYAKAIADDTAAIAQCDKLIELADFLGDTLTDYKTRGFTLFWYQVLLLPLAEETKRAYAALAGLRDEEYEDLLYFLTIEEGVKAAPAGTHSWRNGRIACHRVHDALGGNFLLTKDEAVALRKKYVASLSRHKRNQAKYGA